MKLTSAKFWYPAAATLVAAGLGVTVLTGATGSSAQTPQATAAVACTGSSGDSASLSRALASLQAGGVLTVSGTCDLTSTLSLPTGVTLQGTEGSGGGSTQLDGNVTYTGGGSVTIQGLEIDCHKSGTGLVLQGWQLTVERVTVTDCVNGVELTNPSKAAGDHVNDRIVADFIEGSTKYGFYVNDPGNGVTDGHFDGNYVAGGKVSIYLTNAAGWYIDDNHTYGQSGNAIDAQRMWGTQISGNYIEQYAGYGVDGTVQPGAVGSVVSDNKVFEDDGGHVGTGGRLATGIALVANGSPAFASVTGNVVIETDAVSSAIGLDYDGNGHTFTVASTGNTVAGAGTSVEAVNGATKSAGS